MKYLTDMGYSIAIQPKRKGLVKASAVGPKGVFEVMEVSPNVGIKKLTIEVEEAENE